MHEYHDCVSLDIGIQHNIMPIKMAVAVNDLFRGRGKFSYRELRNHFYFRQADHENFVLNWCEELQSGLAEFVTIQK